MKRPAAARLHIVQSCQLSATLLLVPCIVVMVMACAHCPVIITLQWEGVRGWIPSTASNALHRLGLRQGSADAARKNNADAVAAATAVPEGAHLTDWINGNGGKVIHFLVLLKKLECGWIRHLQSSNIELIEPCLQRL